MNDIPLTKDWVESWNKSNLEAMSGHDLEIFKDLAIQGLDAQAENERLREALKMEQEKFQQETLRTSECSVLLRRWIAQPRPGRLRFHQATDIEDKIYEWRKLVGDSEKLLATPINLGRTQEPKP